MGVVGSTEGLVSVLACGCVSGPVVQCPLEIPPAGPGSGDPAPCFTALAFKLARHGFRTRGPSPFFLAPAFAEGRASYAARVPDALFGLSD